MLPIIYIQYIVYILIAIAFDKIDHVKVLLLDVQDWLIQAIVLLKAHKLIVFLLFA